MRVGGVSVVGYVLLWGLLDVVVLGGPSCVEHKTRKYIDVRSSKHKQASLASFGFSVVQRNHASETTRLYCKCPAVCKH